MGSAKAESAVACLVHMRDGVDFTEGSLRHRDYQQRRQIAALIRERLDRIKGDLGLMQPASMEREASPVDTDLFPTPQKLRSARDLAASVRTMLLSQGEAFLSPIDGSAHRDLPSLINFTEKAKAEVLSADPSLFEVLPSDEEFSMTTLERLVGREAVIRKHLDQLREEIDPNYLTTFVVPEGKCLEEIMEEEEEARRTNKQGADISVEGLENEYRAAREETKKARSEWNAKATAKSKSLMEIAALRAICAQLHQQPQTPLAQSS